MNIFGGIENETYIVSELQIEEEDMKEFLFSLGCYEGEPVTLISKSKGNYIINVKDARYSIDDRLARVIEVEELNCKDEIEIEI